MKKNLEQIQVQVGAFLAIGILLFMAAIFMLGSKTNFFQSHYKLFCYFDDISGLRVGAPVQLAGINVGFIDAISFEDRPIHNETPEVSNKSGKQALPGATHKKDARYEVKVKVIISVDKRYQDRIRTDSVVSVVTQGLLGDRMIFITVGSTGIVVKDGGEISEVKLPSGFTQLVEKGDDLMIDAKVLVRNVNVLVSKLNIVMSEVIEGDGLVHEVIYDKEYSKSLDNLHEMIRNFDQASRDVSSIANKINSGKGTLGSLVNDDSLIESLRTLLGKANRNKLIRSVIRFTLQTKEKEQLK